MVKTYSAGQKISYAYKQTGDFNLRMSDNVSSLKISGSDASNGMRSQLKSVSHINLSVQTIESDCFNSCEKLKTVSFEASGVKNIKSGCFSNCPQLTDIKLSQSLTALSKNVVSSCSELTSVTFPFFESDYLTGGLSSVSEENDRMYNLTKLNAQIFSGCDKLTHLVVPPSISSASQISKNAFNGSNLKVVNFLGISADGFSTEKITSTACYGAGHACRIYTADDKMLRYNGTATTVSDHPYDVRSVLKQGTAEKLRLGRAYQFDDALVKWCISGKVPFVTIALDYSTSRISKSFVQNVLFDETLSKQLKERDFFVFVIDRHGAIDLNDESVPGLKYYRNGFSDMIKSLAGEMSDGFISFNFVYGNNCTSVSKRFSKVSSFLSFLDEYALKTSFNQWDPSQYKVKVDIPDDETVPTGKISTSGITKLPDWYSGGKIEEGTAWEPTSDGMDFRFVSTPDTTYCLICAHDIKNPDYPPKTGVMKIKQVFANHSNHVDCYYNGTEGSREAFLNGIAKGLTYHNFMFFEFSHGSYGHITLYGGVSRSDVWNALKNARNRIIGMFDSCHSGSMIVQSAKPGAFAAQQEDTLINFLAKKFKEQRDERIAKQMKLMRGGFSATAVASAIDKTEPMIWMWSSTAAHNYGWYYPMNSTVFANAIYSAYNVCSEKRNSYMWEQTVQLGSCYIGAGTDECIPQQASYGQDFTKNMTFT